MGAISVSRYQLGYRTRPENHTSYGYRVGMATKTERAEQIAVHLDANAPANTSGRAVTRLTADLPNQDASLLADLAVRTGFNKVTTLVRALRVLDILEKARAAGATVVIENEDGTRERLLLS
jgi:hypothetical protein